MGCDSFKKPYFLAIAATLERCRLGAHPVGSLAFCRHPSASVVGKSFVILWLGLVL